MYLIQVASRFSVLVSGIETPNRACRAHWSICLLLVDLKVEKVLLQQNCYISSFQLFDAYTKGMKLRSCDIKINMKIPIIKLERNKGYLMSIWRNFHRVYAISCTIHRHEHRHESWIGVWQHECQHEQY